jgi:tetratricopeptide (TPR) repeat protein
MFKIKAALLIIFASLVSCNINEGEKYYREAMGLSEWEPRDKKIGLLTLAVNADPGNNIYLFARGREYFDGGHYREALADISGTLSSTDPGLAYRFYINGLTEGRLERFSEAKEDFLQAIKLSPDNAQFYHGLALSEMMLGNLHAALMAVDKALRSVPGHSRWRYTKGIILTLMSREEKAIEQFGRTVYTDRVGENNQITKIYFDGNVEYDRVWQFSKADLLTFWHYGGRWLPEIEIYYRNK